MKGSISRSLIVGVLAAIVVFTPSTAAMASTVANASSVANIPMKGPSKVFPAKPSEPIARAAGEYDIPTYDQRSYSDWWAMTYRCGHVKGDTFWTDWSCFSFDGQNLYKNASNHWYVVTTFTEATGWGGRAHCQVLTSWFNGFRENQESCS